MFQLVDVSTWITPSLSRGRLEGESSESNDPNQTSEVDEAETVRTIQRTQSCVAGLPSYGPALDPQAFAIESIETISTVVEPTRNV